MLALLGSAETGWGAESRGERLGTGCSEILGAAPGLLYGRRMALWWPSWCLAIWNNAKETGKDFSLFCLAVVCACSFWSHEGETVLMLQPETSQPILRICHIEVWG